MINLALWSKANDFRLDQVQNFYPSPLASATTMYYSEVDPLHKVTYKSPQMYVAKGERRRRLQKSLLRYHDAANWPVIREALQEMGLSHLIGSGPGCLVPPEGRPAPAGRAKRPAFTRFSDNQFAGAKEPSRSRSTAKEKRTESKGAARAVSASSSTGTGKKRDSVSKKKS